MVWNVFIDLSSVTIYAPGFAHRKVANRCGKSHVDDVMSRTRQCGHKASRHLVLALRTGFEPLQLMLDAVFDALVITGFEMQAVEIASGSPIAAEQGVLAHEEDRHRDG